MFDEIQITRKLGEFQKQHVRIKWLTCSFALALFRKDYWRCTSLRMLSSCVEFLCGSNLRPQKYSPWSAAFENKVIMHVGRHKQMFWPYWGGASITKIWIFRVYSLQLHRPEWFVHFYEKQFCGHRFILLKTSLMKWTHVYSFVYIPELCVVRECICGFQPV